MDRRTALLGTIALGLAARASAQTAAPATRESKHLTFADPSETIDLWPKGAPGAPAKLPVETVRERSTDPAFNDRYVFGINRPRMAVFRPERPNGACVLITPGGGYNWVVIDKEGYEMARWLAARGVTAFVLFYRLPHEGWAAGPNTPLSDAQRAIRLIRHRACRFRSGCRIRLALQKRHALDHRFKRALDGVKRVLGPLVGSFGGVPQNIYVV